MQERPESNWRPGDQKSVAQLIGMRRKRRRIPLVMPSLPIRWHVRRLSRRGGGCPSGALSDWLIAGRLALVGQGGLEIEAELLLIWDSLHAEDHAAVGLVSLSLGHADQVYGVLAQNGEGLVQVV